MAFYTRKQRGCRFSTCAYQQDMHLVTFMVDWYASNFYTWLLCSFLFICHLQNISCGSHKCSFFDLFVTLMSIWILFAALVTCFLLSVFLILEETWNVFFHLLMCRLVTIWIGVLHFSGRQFWCFLLLF